MQKRSDGFPARPLVTTFVVVSLSVGLAAAAARTPPAASPGLAHATASPLAPAGQATGLVGDDTCTTCHESEGKSLRGTLHGKAQNVRTPAGRAGQSCETCHGPGQKHVDSGRKEDIRRFDAMSSRDVNATCLTCHNKSSHANWQGGMHEARNVSCATCHSVHAPKSERAQLKTATVVQTCETCHKQETMKVKKSGHMPLREGKMDCTTCHSPHGSTNVRMLRVGNSLNEMCASCHAEKRGPFLWDHAAGRENCASCHDPHGSNNDRMLVAKEPMLCQRCHVSSRHPATIYDGTQIAAASNRAIAGDRFLR
jgi:DmsE family decaheme c-type cytochrome